jgi:hypothetical protein
VIAMANTPSLKASIRPVSFSVAGSRRIVVTGANLAETAVARTQPHAVNSAYFRP